MNSQDWFNYEVEIAPGITKRLGDMTKPELERAGRYNLEKGREHQLIGEAFLKRAAQIKTTGRRRKGSRTIIPFHK